MNSNERSSVKGLARLNEELYNQKALEPASERKDTERRSKKGKGEKKGKILCPHCGLL